MHHDHPSSSFPSWHAADTWVRWKEQCPNRAHEQRAQCRIEACERDRPPSNLHHHNHRKNHHRGRGKKPCLSIDRSWQRMDWRGVDPWHPSRPWPSRHPQCHVFQTHQHCHPASSSPRCQRPRPSTPKPPFGWSGKPITVPPTAWRVPNSHHCEASPSFLSIAWRNGWNCPKCKSTLDHGSFLDENGFWIWIPPPTVPILRRRHPTRSWNWPIASDVETNVPVPRRQLVVRKFRTPLPFLGRIHFRKSLPQQILLRRHFHLRGWRKLTCTCKLRHWRHRANRGL
mmetsp:Transcript_4888/g.11153  ORF Transcript_4888/g.11153 Transcript_4888/m.11153 type:complete len:284 (-) Transcript_4888:1353-2204(-)